MGAGGGGLGGVGSVHMPIPRTQQHAGRRREVTRDRGPEDVFEWGANNCRPRFGTKTHHHALHHALRKYYVNMSRGVVGESTPPLLIGR